MNFDPYDELPPRPFSIQRRRLGMIKFVEANGKFGFINAEDFREDVFFHHSVWQAGHTGRCPDLREGLFVEFELDEAYRASEGKLRALIVRVTDRPMGKRMTSHDTPHLIPPRHPKARRKRPTWRSE